MNLRSLTMRAVLPSLVLTALPLAGCGGEPSYVAAAQREGIAVHHREVADQVVERICDNMEAGRGPLLHVIPNEYLETALSTNDRRLMQLGVEMTCPQHASAYNAIWAEMDRAAAEAASYVHPDFNVGPDGFCVGTPCGSNGRVPEVDGQPYSP